MKKSAGKTGLRCRINYVPKKKSTQCSMGTDINLVQKSTFDAIMNRLSFNPNLIVISSTMLARKFHPSCPMAYPHKCPLNHALAYGGSKSQIDPFCDPDCRFRFLAKNCLRKLSFFLLYSERKSVK